MTKGKNLGSRSIHSEALSWHEIIPAIDFTNDLSLWWSRCSSIYRGRASIQFYIELHFYPFLIYNNVYFWLFTILSECYSCLLLVETLWMTLLNKGIYILCRHENFDSQHLRRYLFSTLLCLHKATWRSRLRSSWSSKLWTKVVVRGVNGPRFKCFFTIHLNT